MQGYSRENCTKNSNEVLESPLRMKIGMFINILLKTFFLTGINVEGSVKDQVKNMFLKGFR